MAGRRGRTRLLLLGGLVTGAALDAVAQDRAACHGIRPPSGTVGIRALECVGSACLVNVTLDGAYAHVFTTEPIIRELDSSQPASQLRRGDAIVAVDRALITSREGGIRLANLKPGTPIALRIRRAGTEVALRLTPVPGCDTPNLAVVGGTGAGDELLAALVPSRQPRPAIDLGLELECGTCGWRTTSTGALAWFSERSPVVVGLVTAGPAEQAGVRVGDVIVELAAQSLAAPTGSTTLGALRPNITIPLRVRRGERVIALSITPRAQGTGRRPF